MLDIWGSEIEMKDSEMRSRADMNWITWWVRDGGEEDGEGRNQDESIRLVNSAAPSSSSREEVRGITSHGDWLRGQTYVSSLSPPLPAVAKSIEDSFMFFLILILPLKQTKINKKKNTTPHRETKPS